MNTPISKLWLLYGATGYSGKLIAQQAIRQGLQPILAGRSTAVYELATSLGLSARVFDLADRKATLAALQAIDLVLNCAGPFSATAQAMIKACLARKAHYLDITGEIAVFEYAHSQHDEAREQGIVLCPGVGFDVIPTDCMAAALKETLPDACELMLGFDTASGLSPGTLKSMIEALPLGGMVRQDGRIIGVPLGYKIRTVDFGFGLKSAVTIPWGDISTAYRTTGIPNIETYIAIPKTVAYLMRYSNWTRGLLKRPAVQRFLKRCIEQWVKGPDAEQRATLRTAVWGQARNEHGDICSARIETDNGYALTITGALALTQHLLGSAPAQGGHYTPAKLCGWRLIETLPGSGKMQISILPSTSTAV